MKSTCSELSETKRAASAAPPTAPHYRDGGYAVKENGASGASTGHVLLPSSWQERRRHSLKMLATLRAASDEVYQRSPISHGPDRDDRRQQAGPAAEVTMIRDASCAYGLPSASDRAVVENIASRPGCAGSLRSGCYRQVSRG